MYNLSALSLRMHLRKENSIVVSLTGRCMEPLLIEGDLVKVRQDITPEEGDFCLVLLPDGQLGLHRLLEWNGGFALTKGDRTKKYEILDEKSVFGIAVFVKPEGNKRWCEMKQFRWVKKLSVFLSGRTQNHAGKYRPVYRIPENICLNLLAGINRCVRCSWTCKRNPAKGS